MRLCPRALIFWRGCTPFMVETREGRARAIWLSRYWHVYRYSDFYRGATDRRHLVSAWSVRGVSWAIRIGRWEIQRLCRGWFS